MEQFIIGANQAGQRFDKFLHKYLPEAPNSFLYKMLRKKNITLNGKKAEGKEMLCLGDEVKLFFSEETLAKFSGRQTACHASSGPACSSYRSAYRTLNELAEPGGIAVLYEDRNVLILNKPAGILTQKADEKDLSLNEWMIGYLLEKEEITEEELYTFRPSVCNRLDRNTSGLVLCGKSLAGSQAFSRIIRERTVRKFYRTIAAGCIDRPCRIEGYLIKDEISNRVSITSVRDSASDASYIQTSYVPIEVMSAPSVPQAGQDWAHHPLSLSKNPCFTYLEVELITGKTHQIRAHLAGTGHPLLGDYKYGLAGINNAFRTCCRLDSQLLHAYRLEFPKLDGALAGLSNMEITAPLPDRFLRVLELFRCNTEGKD